MFYCDECRKKNGWPESLFSFSRGSCEMCGEYAVCHDVHHSRLPDPPSKDDSKATAPTQE